MCEEHVHDITQHLGFTDEARRNIVRGNTNRETGDITREGADAERRVSEWRSVSPDALRNHAVVETFQSELRNAELVSAQLICYRGRVSPAIPSDSNEYGPPKPERTGQGRYNETGQPVLYLAASEEGVLRELASRTGEMWCHQFDVPTADLRIADLQPNMALPVINHAFDFAEQGDGDYFSRILAHLIAEAEFDGMLVPGVRGELGNAYNNVVLFRYESWNAWLRGKPQRLR